MRKMTLFNGLILITLFIVAIGFYRGWFVLGSRDVDNDSNQVEVQLTVDPDKAKDDAKAMETKARELMGGEEEKAPSGTPEVNVNPNDE